MKRLILTLLASCGAVYAQQNALLLPWTPQQFTNTNGTVLANGKVCTYLAGTSTGVATYTDATASVANNIPPNAILLDSTGRPTSGGIWLKPTQAYKIIVLTAGSDNTCSTGVTIKTQDNVGISASVSANNTFTGTNTFTGQLNCKNFDGISCLDDTNSQGFAGTDLGGWLNSAYSRCLAGTCGIDLYPSSGNATAFTTPVTFTTNDRLVDFTCRSSANTSATGGLVMNYTPTTATSAITFDNTAPSGIHWTPQEMKDCALVNNPGSLVAGGSGSSASGIASGIVNGGLGWMNFANNSILGFGNGIKLAGGATNGWGSVFTNSTIGLNNTGVNVTGQQEVVHFTNSRFMANGVGYKQTGAGDAVFVQPQFDSNTTSAIDTSGVGGGGVTTVMGGHYENFNTANCLYGTFGGTVYSHFGGAILNDTTMGNCVEQFHLPGSVAYHVVGATVSSAGQTATQVFNVVSPATGYFEIGNAVPGIYPSDTNIIGGTSLGYEAHICTVGKACHQALFNNNTGAVYVADFGRVFHNSNAMVSIHYDAATDHGLLLEYITQGGASQAKWAIGPGEAGNNDFAFNDFTNSTIRARLSQAGAFFLPTAGSSVSIAEGTAPAASANNDICYADSTLHALKCAYNNGTFFQIPQVLSATSAAFATATTAGTCVQNTTAVANAATTMAVSVAPVSTPGVGAVWSGFVSSAGNVTINECAVATSAGGSIAFNIRVTP